MDLDGFHPAVASWFRGQFPAATEVQHRAWRAIGAGSHTLISAPTGSGKTLAAFLGVIDTLVKRGLEGGLADETRILYVSPLKALSNDINKNLQAPLAGIRDKLLESGLPDVRIRALVRTGDTTQSERAKMRRQSPHILVTTPESLYILLTSESGRRMLATVETVIVDEIHALAGNKRGAHLAVSLERLAALCERPPTRVGVSATTRPMEAMVEFLVGIDRSPCQVIDQGHVRHWDLRLELPSSPLEAIMSNEVWVEIYDRLAALAADHRTTIVFVNTRRLAERVARHLADRCGEDQVTSHHGSLSREHRLKAEERLKAGKLKVLVATASLELGIDIGEVDLVCQLGSPRGIARLLQRVGRSGHGVNRVPKGRLVPLSRDELVECAALLDAVARGELDAVALCRKPLDVLSQQIVAEVSMREWEVDALFDLIIRSAPFRELSRNVYLDVLKMLANGFTTQRGRRGAYLHHDRVNGRLRPRRAARLTAVTNGGTIPDQFDYDVTLVPGELFVGTLNEDFAFESMPGDIFQLGNTSYRILKVHSGKVFVEDARGLPPTIPFWFGEAPGRSDELSAAVSRLRREVDEALADEVPADEVPADEAPGSQAPGSQEGGSQTPGSDSTAIARVAKRLVGDHSLPPVAAEQLCEYLASARAALGGLPTAERIVIERFFDEAGDTHIVVHSPYGSRLNRAWGLALRKRFCRRFNFELQAAALEDTIVISLGVVHSFPLEEVVRYLAQATVADVLTQAVLDAPIFPGRWRWNASVALAVRRFRNGKRAPAHFQRTDAEDLLATVFPDQLACAENLAGEREIPDHPLVAQTLQDCLRGVMDIDGLAELLGRIEAGEVEVACRELTSPSPLAQEVLSAKPYAFLDDAPAEERRTLAIQSRRHLTVEQAADLGRLDPEAIQRVRSEAWPDFRDEDELHDALVVLGFMAPPEPGETADVMLERLVADGRASRFRMSGDGWVWISAERLAELEMAVEDGRTDPRIEALECDVETPEAALRELIRSRMEGLGPVTAAELGRPLGLNDRDVASALMALEAEGFAMRGRFSEPAAQSPPVGQSQSPADIESPSRSTSTTRSASPAEPAEEWCDRRLLARIHRYTLKRLRSEIEPVSIAVYQRFLFRWQGLGRERRQGGEALAAVIGELQGLALQAAAWEREILPARLTDYSPVEMDELAVSGRITWYRPMTRQQWIQAAENGPQRGRGTVANSPI
ncbi:MAG: DEAD/DEAH box helicase, partial [Proteobacteria bacterium]|nr:DEAD/DEAH box helicase [Pseudomonadota bacterium]